MPPRRAQRGARQVTLAHLLLAAAVVAPTTFLIRQMYPIGDETLLGGFNFWEWPACITAFTLGVIGFRQGRLEAVPEHLASQCRTVCLVTIGLFVAFMGTAALVGALDEVEWRAALTGSPSGSTSSKPC